MVENKKWRISVTYFLTLPISHEKHALLSIVDFDPCARIHQVEQFQ